MAFTATLSSPYLDPYSTLSGPTITRSDYKLIHHAVHTFYPAFDLGVGRFHTPAFAHNWNSLVSAGSDIFHGVMWQVSINLSFLTKRPITNRETLRHHQRTLEEVSKAVRQPVETIAEPTIYAIVNLTIPDQHMSERSTVPVDTF